MESSKPKIEVLYRKQISFGLFILAGLCIFLPFINKAEMTGMSMIDKITSYSLFEIIKGGDIFGSTGVPQIWGILYVFALLIGLSSVFRNHFKAKCFVFYQGVAGLLSLVMLNSTFSGEKISYASPFASGVIQFNLGGGFLLAIFVFFVICVINRPNSLEEIKSWFSNDEQLSHESFPNSIQGQVIDDLPKTAQVFISEGDELNKKANNLSGKEADNLYKLAYEKYKIAAEIEPKNITALIDMSFVLLTQAKNEKDKEITNILDEAEKILLKVEKIETGIGAYNLACLYAIRDDEEKCSLWLNKALNYNHLPDREEVLNDSDFNKMKGRDWFKEFIGKVK